MSKSVKILIGMAVVAIILFVLSQVIKPKGVSISNSDRYITINSEQMPSIYDKLGAKLITNITEGNDKSGKYIEITYGDIDYEEILLYITELGNLNYALIESSESSITLAKEASKEGVVLSITITANYTENSATIKYARGTGILTRD